jgi:hypothetical protein
MKARQLIEGAGFNPEQLHVVMRAFNDAWEMISPTVSKHTKAIEASRLKLASTVLAVAALGPIEYERVKADALHAMYSAPIELGFRPHRSAEKFD